MAQGEGVMRFLALISILTAGAGIGWMIWPNDRDGIVSTETPRSLVQGKRLYAEYCASCHGVYLEGEPNWQSADPNGLFPAPPHDETGHTWHHSDSLLFSYTKLGGQAAMARQGVAFDSGMPAFGDQLSDEDIRDVFAFIRSNWPEHIHKAQAERTRLDQQQAE